MQAHGEQAVFFNPPALPLEEGEMDGCTTCPSCVCRTRLTPVSASRDRAFVTDVADDPVDFAVARAVVDMARAMGRTTVAEGVETADQFHRLRGIGVDAYQGWLFSKAGAGRGAAGSCSPGTGWSPPEERPERPLTDHVRSPLSGGCG